MPRRARRARRMVRAAGTILAVASAWGTGFAGSAVAVTEQPTTAEAPASQPSMRVPEGLTDDLTVWPNQVCYRTSEPWILENHDRLRKIRPRVLVLNFANDVEMNRIQDHTERLIRALAESTRYHGYEDPSAPAFLEYDVVKYVDMRDRPVPLERAHRNSAFFPAMPGVKDFFCDYGAFYGDGFARFYGFADPRHPRKFLNLHELIDAGRVHELWFYAIHDHAEGWPGHEVIEYKAYYDDRCQPIEDQHGPAGNGHSDTMPWSGRTFRMAFFNPHRDIGCAMENFAHGLEGIANFNAIAYYKKYFDEYAELDLHRRYNVPFNCLYRVDYGVKDAVTYPRKDAMQVRYRGKDILLDPYVWNGGNVHWPPGARFHYDLDSPYTVLSTIENWRRRNGPDGKDKVTEFNKDQYARFADVAPDCMGRWVVFWRQCMPGLNNPSLDDDGRPMKNWWVFLIY